MARRRASKRGPGKRSWAPRPSSRLPDGRYAWRGHAVAFSDLPQSERARHRARWAVQAAKERAKERAKVEADKARKSARAWLERRTAKIPTLGHENQYAGMVPAHEIARRYSPATILEIRDHQRAAHAAYMKQGKHAGGDALRLAGETLDLLGPELAAIMPQLWWYH